jgi:hypothetical protein
LCRKKVAVWQLRPPVWPIISTGTTGLSGQEFIQIGVRQKMTDAFQNREKGFERKYQMDRDQEFRVQARRDKLFGAWLAERFGLSGDEAEAYTLEVVDSNFEKPGDDDMMDKVKADIAERGASIDEAELASKLSDCMHEAYKQIVEDA